MRLRKTPSSFGIVPVILLLLARSSSRFDKSPNEIGKVPEISLSKRKSDSEIQKRAIIAG